MKTLTHSTFFSHLALELGVKVLEDCEYCKSARIKGEYSHEESLIILRDIKDVATLAHELVHCLQYRFGVLLTSDPDDIWEWCDVQGIPCDDYFLHKFPLLWAKFLEYEEYEEDEYSREYFAYYVQYGRGGLELFKRIVQDLGL